MNQAKSRPKTAASKLSSLSGHEGSGDENARQAGGAKGFPRFPIVGIGASAGGLEALTILFRELPPDLGMAFILIPHLEPSRESAVSQILGRSTRMPVLEVTDGMRIAPNHVYVIPPNHDMTIAEGVLHLGCRPNPRSVNTTIDTFLRSLATGHGSDAIGVILSGTASDGTLGLAAIKGEGGITLAQEPGSAKYDGMPASAIASGCVDFILDPAGIAREIARIRHRRYAANGHEIVGHQSNDDSDMGQIFRLLRRVTGVDFSEYKSPTIGRRIQRRMALHKIGRLRDYVALLHHDPQEATALYQDLLINVTSFFRNPEAFEALKLIVYPSILQARDPGSGPIRIWVPGCSTGEETYSLAISMVEFLAAEQADIPIQIFGTDLSGRAIARARVGIFKENIEADVSPARLRRFFHKAEGGYQIRKSIRDLCIFSTQNVFSDPPFSRMDLVSCRNVMIYLGQSLQKRVIAVFHYALNLTGYLLIGNTEGLLGAGSELFEMADKKQKIYRKKLVPTPVAFGFALGKTHPDQDDQEVMDAGISLEVAKVPMELQREADWLLLARYVPPAVLVNHQLEILQTRGHTGSFLELPSGKASLNLLKMARPGLFFELQAAIDEARQQGFETRRQNVRVDDDQKATLVTIRVIPFKVPTHEKQSFLIVFESTSSEDDRAPAVSLVKSQPAPLGSEPDGAEGQSRKQLRQVQQELAATREYLQSIIESQDGTYAELQSANEETQSGNEELQSANEELQTSKEELESANEELHTVNEEMQHRNELLTQLNNDLTNVLQNVSLPIVMVAGDLSVRRFTPQAAEMLGLTPNDIGRPLPRLRLKIDMGNLEHNMLDAIQYVESKKFRVQNNDGKWCILRVVPYRTMDNRVDGVVLSVVNERGSKPDSAAGLNIADGPIKKTNGRSKTASRRK
jgi:two-component system, chemotaxis family, CheB/CheR fusion protein